MMIEQPAGQIGMRYLRPELLPPCLDHATVERLTRIADQIIELIDRRGEFRPLLARFNVEAGTDLTPLDFLAAAGSMAMTEFVRRALIPPPQRVPDITYDELLEVVTRICE